MLSHFSLVQLLETLWTVALQAPVSTGFSRQEYWSGLPYPPIGNLPDSGIKPASPAAAALQADSLPLSHQRSPVPLTLCYLLQQTLKTNTATHKTHAHKEEMQN